MVSIPIPYLPPTCPYCLLCHALPRCPSSPSQNRLLDELGYGYPGKTSVEKGGQPKASGRAFALKKTKIRRPVSAPAKMRSKSPKIKRGLKMRTTGEEGKPKVAPRGGKIDKPINRQHIREPRQFSLWYSRDRPEARQDGPEAQQDRPEAQQERRLRPQSAAGTEADPEVTSSAFSKANDLASAKDPLSAIRALNNEKEDEEFQKMLKEGFRPSQGKKPKIREAAPEKQNAGVHLPTWRNERPAWWSEGSARRARSAMASRFNPMSAGVERADMKDAWKDEGLLMEMPTSRRQNRYVHIQSTPTRPLPKRPATAAAAMGR